MANDDVKPPANIDRLMAWWSLRQWATNHLPRDAFADFLKLTERDLQQYLNPFPVTLAYDSEPPRELPYLLAKLLVDLTHQYDFKLTPEDWGELEKLLRRARTAAIRHPGPDPAKKRAATRIFRTYLAQGGDPTLQLYEAARAAGFAISNGGDTFTKDGDSYSRSIVGPAWREAVNG